MICIKSKVVRVINRHTDQKSTRSLQWVYSDYWESYRVTSLDEKWYILMFINKFTQYSWIYLTEDCKILKTCFTSWKSNAESQSEEKLIIIQSDQSSEYKDLKRRLKHQDIKIKFTAAYTSEQNDILECLNHTLVKTASALLVDVKLSHIF